MVASGFFLDFFWFDFFELTGEDDVGGEGMVVCGRRTQKKREWRKSGGVVMWLYICFSWLYIDYML